MAKAEKVQGGEESGFAYNCLVGAGEPDHGESLTCWALFDRKDIPEEFIKQHQDENDDFDLATALTPWYSFYRGAGRWFGSDPYCKIGRNHVLIKQHRGLDI